MYPSGVLLFYIIKNKNKSHINIQWAFKKKWGVEHSTGKEHNLMCIGVT